MVICTSLSTLFTQVKLGLLQIKIMCLCPGQVIAKLGFRLR